MDQLLGYFSGLAGVAILGLIKKGTGWADARIAPVIKPIQPILAGALGIALPMLAVRLHLAQIPDATILTTAPAATLVGIAAAEYYRRIAGPPK